MKRILGHVLALLLMILIVPARAEFSFPDVFLEEGQPAVRTETGYLSQDVAISITGQRYVDSDVFVADIHVRDLDSFLRSFAGGKWNSGTMTMSKIAEDSGAILALTGDYAHYFEGWLMANGELLRNTRNPSRDLCLIYRNGEMRTVLAQDIDDEWLTAELPKLWHIFCFGPTLLDAEGKALTGRFNSVVQPDNPRSVLGYYEPGHYCFVQVDGRGTKSRVVAGEHNIGLDMWDLAALMESLGCRVAYNLDGGMSSMMWFDGDLVSTPYEGGRPIGDILLIREPSDSVGD